jgi:hypothetical protein
MRRHREISELHRFLLSYWAKSTTIGRLAQGPMGAWLPQRRMMRSREGI